MKRVVSIFFLLPFSILAADTNALPALVPAYGELPVTFWERHHVAIILSVIAFLAVIALLLFFLLRAKPPVVLTPEAIARQALEKLQSRPEDGKMLSEVSQILRRYLCTVFGISSAEMTTAEFCNALTSNRVISLEFVQKITIFLRACDKDKFSPNVIAPPLSAVKRALEMIETVEQHYVRPKGASQ
ncbi:MAG TPA: hypothetical protein VG347_05965 [Verrucomicrobiae bacterium]|nr:hypothetical protein [Verrucomicrobiae bacterium]